MKKLFYVFLAVTLAFAMVACGGGSSSSTPAATPTVTSVTVTGASQILQGGTVQFSAAVVGTNSPAQTVTWSVTGGEKAGTSISTGGLLTAAADEPNGTVLTVKAASTVDPTKSGTATVTVYDAASIPTVNSVTVSPATASVAKGGTQQFAASVVGDNNPAQTVTWSVSGTLSNISTAGLLTVAAEETAATLTVTATSTADPTKTGTATVTVTGDDPGPSGPVVEKLVLENNAYAIFKFGDETTVWGNYKEITAEYKLSQDVLDRIAGSPSIIRGIRLYGPFPEEAINNHSNERLYADHNTFNTASYMIQNLGGANDTFADTYAVSADQWFTITYDVVTTSATHLPDAEDVGPFYFALGIAGQNHNANGVTGQFPGGQAVTQLIRNVTLVSYDGDVDVVSEGSGFDEMAFGSYAPVYSWRGAENATPQIPGIACACGDVDCECVNCAIDPETGWCQNHCCEAATVVPATKDWVVNLAGFIDGTNIEAGTNGGIRNKVRLTTAGNYAEAFRILLDFAAANDGDVDIHSYSTFSLTAKRFKVETEPGENEGDPPVETGNLIEISTGGGQTAFISGATVADHPDYSFTFTNKATSTIPGFQAGIDGIAFKKGDVAGAYDYIELISLTFHKE